MYDVEFTSGAERQLKKLERALQERIVAALERIRVRPQDYLERLAGETSYKLRVGDYRIIIDLDEEKLVILIIKVGHRGSIYK